MWVPDTGMGLMISRETATLPCATYFAVFKKEMGQRILRCPGDSLDHEQCCDSSDYCPCPVNDSACGLPILESNSK